MPNTSLACASRTICCASPPFRPYAPMRTKLVQSCFSESGAATSPSANKKKRRNANRAFRVIPVLYSGPHPATPIPAHPAARSEPSTVSAGSLELESQSKVEGSRIFSWRVARNCPEQRISYGRIRLSKAWVVGQVEHLRPHLDPRSFFGHKRLVKIQVHVVDAVDAQR